MGNLWKQQGIPHKGWTLENVYDVRDDGQSEDETSYESCMMCGHEKIRYVHVVSHPDYGEELLVGCQCAEKLTGDYENPQRREKELKNRTTRRTNFLKRTWKISAKGNEYINVDNHNIIIKEDSTTHKFTVKIDDTWGKKHFDTSELAKIAAFKGIEYFKEKGDW